MILLLPASGGAQLLQSNDLLSLRCDIALAESQRDIAQVALHGIASLDRSHAWISADWLRRLGALDNGHDWLPRFEIMIDKARSHGWVSADRRSVKAHIVWNNL